LNSDNVEQNIYIREIENDVDDNLKIIDVNNLIKKTAI